MEIFFVNDIQVRCATVRMHLFATCSINVNIADVYMKEMLTCTAINSTS